MNQDGVTTATMLLLAAFAVDRVAAAVTFVICRPRRKGDAQDAERADWSKKLCYFTVAAVLAGAILAATTKIRLLQAMGMVTDTTGAVDKLIDLALTFMILVGGAERISAFLQSPAEPEKPAEPLQVSGTITLTDQQRSRGATP